MTIKPTVILDTVGYLLGWSITASLWLCSSVAFAAPVLHPQLAPVTLSMLIATVIGALGSYLAFGEDRKFPPSATSVGHVLLGFGAGLFFTRGSLELMGRLNSSEDLVVLVSFLWAVGGYFILRLAIAVLNSNRIKELLPEWVAKVLGVDK